MDTNVVDGKQLATSAAAPAGTNRSCLACKYRTGTCAAAVFWFPVLEANAFGALTIIECLPVAEFEAQGVDTEIPLSAETGGLRIGDGYRYRAELPPLPGDAEVQVLVGTLRGGVASATFRSGAAGSGARAGATTRSMASAIEA